jgi:signal transduction histidine kinase
MRKHFSRADRHRTDRLDLSGLLAQAAEPGVITVDPAGRIVGINGPGERMTLLKASEAVGASLKTLPPPLQDVIEQTLESGNGLSDRPLLLPGVGQVRQIVFVSTMLVRGASQDPLAVLVVLHDLTAARDFEVKTERIQRLASLGVLAAGVAHEIKNALVAIKTFAELLLEQGKQDNEMVTLVVEEVNRINSLVVQLLKLAGPAKPVFTEVPAHESIENALRLVRHQLKNRSIELVVSLDAGSDAVRGDAKQLEQAFINLLLNAIEALGDSGRLTIGTEVVFATELLSKFEPRTRKQQLQITIRDTGAGIPPQILDNLYAPFRTTKPGGTGLGLAITRRIVMAHGGRIAVESQAGLGTAFKITLPLIAEVRSNGNGTRT